MSCKKYVILYLTDPTSREHGHTHSLTHSYTHTERHHKNLLGKIYISNPTAFLEDSTEATLVRQILGSIHQFQRDSSNQRLKGARERSAIAKGRRSVLSGKLKASGAKSRLEGAEAETIKAALF